MRGATLSANRARKRPVTRWRVGSCSWVSVNVAPQALHRCGACATPTRQSHGDRQVAHLHPGAFHDAHVIARSAGTARGAREQFDLQVEPLAGLLHLGHDKASQPDQAGSVVLHPVFVLASRCF
jgi:hypothetical protein